MRITKKLMIFFIMFSSCSFANSSQSFSGSEEHKPTTSQLTNEDAELRLKNALELGLTKEDLVKYDAIMNGPKGNFFRRGDANYFYVLGAESNSDQESLRYARLWIKAESRYYTNVAKMLRMYDVASLELFGENPVMFDILGRDSSENTPTKFSSSRVGRVKVFIQLTSCSSCDAMVLREMDKLNRGVISGLDIFVANTNGDNKVIRKWATMLKLEPEMVKQRVITLNHASSEQVKNKTIPSLEISFE
ncbi:hypothetical protein FPV63_12680 [Vibrio cholerae]|nr:hypothetical protein FPV63_12680 [Vibrio cholerae]